MFQIVISKLRQQTALDHDRRHLKAAKVLHCHCVIIVPHLPVIPYCVFQAMVFVMPLLGMGYLVTLVPPDKEESMAAYQVFSLARSLLLSTQVSSHHTGK